MPETTTDRLRDRAANTDATAADPDRGAAPSAVVYESPRDPGRLLKASLEDVSANAVRGGSVRWSLLLVIFGLLLGAVGGVSAYRRLRGDGGQAGGKVFLRYVHHLRLPWTDALLLWRIARAAKLPTPLTLLVSSGALQHHGRQFVAGLSANRRKRILRRLSAIQRVAFGVHDDSGAAAEALSAATPPETAPLNPPIATS